MRLPSISIWRFTKIYLSVAFFDFEYKSRHIRKGRKVGTKTWTKYNFQFDSSWFNFFLTLIRNRFSTVFHWLELFQLVYVSYLVLWIEIFGLALHKVNLMWSANIHQISIDQYECAHGNSNDLSERMFRYIDRFWIIGCLLLTGFCSSNLRKNKLIGIRRRFFFCFVSYAYI